MRNPDGVGTGKPMIARRGKISVLAAGASAAVHLALLGGFASVRLGAPAESHSVVGAVSIQAVRRPVEQPLITPKPEVKMESKPVAQQDKPTPMVSQSAPVVADESRPQPPVQIPQNTSTTSSTASSTTSSTASGMISGTVSGAVSEAGFFGQETAAQTVCFVVDCSGSMYGRLELIRRQLKDCIASLRDTQSFYLIFFMDGDKLLESGDGKAVPAAGYAKAQAFAMIDRIRLEGQTNARQALERAMKIRDARGRPMELIYFLTDGFDLQISSPGAFCRDIERIQSRYAPSVTINTIGLWASPEDQRMLERIAKMTGGQFVSVE